jgi:hypothetical protein
MRGPLSKPVSSLEHNRQLVSSRHHSDVKQPPMTACSSWSRQYRGWQGPYALAGTVVASCESLSVPGVDGNTTCRITVIIRSSGTHASRWVPARLPRGPLRNRPSIANRRRLLTMKSVQSVSLALVVAGVLGLAAASASAATNPLFSPASGQAILGTSGLSFLTADNGIQTIDCRKDVFSGVVANALLLGGIIVHYLECTSEKKGTAPCTAKVNSEGAPSGLIVTATLHGILGLILSPPLTSVGVGILILPVKGKEFFNLESNGCTELSAVSGNIAAELTPVGHSQKTGKTVFATSGGKQAIKDIDLTHGLGLVVPKLTTFTTEATLEQVENTDTSANLEVT